MSIKVYKGFKTEAKDFFEVMAKVQAFRPILEKKAQAICDQFIEANSSSDIDSKADAWAKWLNLREELVEKRKLKLPNLDTSFSLAIFPHCENSSLVGIAYTEHLEWFQDWCAQPGVCEYGYWNNSDKPDEVSETEWLAREIRWRSLLSHNPVSMDAFVIEVANPMGPFPQLIC